MTRAVADAAPLFAALGDPTRLRLVARLSKEGPLSISRLAEGESMSRQAIAKHLRLLEAAGLVEGARAGRSHVFELRTRRLAEIHRHLDRISTQWDRALGRLRDLVEG